MESELVLGADGASRSTTGIHYPSQQNYRPGCTERRIAVGRWSESNGRIRLEETSVSSDVIGCVRWEQNGRLAPGTNTPNPPVTARYVLAGSALTLYVPMDGRESEVRFERR